MRLFLHPFSFLFLLGKKASLNKPKQQNRNEQGLQQHSQTSKTKQHIKPTGNTSTNEWKEHQKAIPTGDTDGKKRQCGATLTVFLIHLNASKTQALVHQSLNTNFSIAFKNDIREVTIRSQRNRPPGRLGPHFTFTSTSMFLTE